jgi:hypothetical protein
MYYVSFTTFATGNRQTNSFIDCRMNNIMGRQGKSEPAHHKGWMVSGLETVFCWVPGPEVTMVVSSVAFF